MIDKSNQIIYFKTMKEDRLEGSYETNYYNKLWVRDQGVKEE